MRATKKIGITLAAVGFLPIRMVKAIFGLPVFIKNFINVCFQDKSGWKLSLFPMLADRYEQSGVASGHYFHMDLWAARLVYSLQCSKPVDVGSRVDGFVAHVLTFRDIEVFDVRPLVSKVRGLIFQQINMTEPNAAPIGYSDCVTSLHTLEHFGLGRYGDKVDMHGWKTGLQNLARMVKEGGNLIIAVPVGRERIEFDAHRVFDPETIIAAATALGLKMETYAAVDDEGCFHEQAGITDSGCYEYGCGCFHFVKPKISTGIL